MTRVAGSVPILTEVIELAAEPLPLDAALPSAREALAVEDLPLGEVLACLQPRLEAWMEVRVRAALGGLQARWADEAVAAIGQELRAALPDMVAQALTDLTRERQR